MTSMYPATNRRRRLVLAKGHYLRPFRLHADGDWFVATCAFCAATIAINRDTGDVAGIESRDCPKRKV